jgi:predicted Zn-dependent protease
VRPTRALLPSIALLVAGCAVNPATGQRQLSLISEQQEIQMGRQANQDVESSLGLVQNESLQAYVAGIGKTLAARSERPDLPWSFQVVDDPVVNAFALPGGFIYVTRGIMAYFESEAELAGVLGHEIGHVTARHSVNQMSRQQIQQIGLGVGMILSQDVRNYGDLLSAGLGLLDLKYSRGDETQADELGVRYMTRAGYDPDALLGVFEMLQSVSGAEGGRVPEWQSTHPYPENREAHIRQVMEQNQVPGGGTVGRDALLDHIDGIVYGENPREGYFKDDLFLHPELAFQIRFPAGWNTVNQRSAVGAVSPGKDGLVVLEPVTDATDPTAALRAFLAQDGVQGGSVATGEDHGIPTARAPFTAQTSDGGEIRGEAEFLTWRGGVFRILGYAPSARWSTYASVVSRSMGSFAPVTDRAVLDVQPQRLQLVTIPRAMTVTEFNQRYPSAVPVEEVARLNRRAVGDVLPAGTRVKRVVGDALP